MVLRLAEVQPPKITLTSSSTISRSASAAKVGQSDCPSTTTGTTFLPKSPPLSLISSIAKRVASTTEVSLMAIVPDKE